MQTQLKAALERIRQHNTTQKTTSYVRASFTVVLQDNIKDGRSMVANDGASASRVRGGTARASAVAARGTTAAALPAGIDESSSDSDYDEANIDNDDSDDSLKWKTKNRARERAKEEAAQKRDCATGNNF